MCHFILIICTQKLHPQENLDKSNEQAVLEEAVVSIYMCVIEIVYAPTSNLKS